MSDTAKKLRLYVVTAHHTIEDMGSLGNNLPESAKKQADQNVKKWDNVEESLEKLGLDYKKVMIYQDGLANVSLMKLLGIIDSVQSRNYKLIRKLIEEGAIPVGTEDPQLLQEEYNLLSNVINAQDKTSKNEASKAYALRADSLLSERDQYIAKIIDDTLGKTSYQRTIGILFIGIDHHVEEYLNPNIECIRLETSGHGVESLRTNIQSKERN